MGSEGFLGSCATLSCLGCCVYKVIPPDTLSASEQQNMTTSPSVSQPKMFKPVPILGKENVFSNVVTQRFPHLSVELDSQDGVGVGVVADFSSLLEMTDLEFSRSLEADDGHQTAGEQTLHNAHILRVHW